MIEDDDAIRAAVVTLLSLEGHAVTEAVTATQGRSLALNSDYDLLLLDLALPGGDGLDILRALRAARNPVPVLILTARGAEQDRVLGLRTGADDYLVKPFGADELAARVEALLRRCGAKVRPLGGSLRIASVVVDFASLTITWPQGTATVTEQEGALLRLLAQRAPAVVPRAELQALLWPDQPVDLHSRALDMAVCRLRDKLGPETACLVTVRGVGLRLDGVDTLTEA